MEINCSRNLNSIVWTSRQVYSYGVDLAIARGVGITSGAFAMSDFLVAGLVILALAAVANLGAESSYSPGCKPGNDWSLRIC